MVHLLTGLIQYQKPNPFHLLKNNNDLKRIKLLQVLSLIKK